MVKSKMSFGAGFEAGAKGIAQFDGRARRMELFSYGSVVTVVWLAIEVWLLSLGESVPALLMKAMPWIYAVLMLAVTWRRYQDLGREGYYSLVLFVAVYGLVIDFGFEGEIIVKYVLLGVAGFLLYLLMQDGQRETNAFGPSPKYVEG